MQSSIFRRLRLATFAFLALVVVGLVISAWLTAREQQRLIAAEAEMARVNEFERVQILVSRRLLSIGGTPAEDVGGKQFVAQQIDHLIELADAPEVPARLRAVRVQVLSVKGGIIELTQVLLQFNEATTVERAHHATVLERLEQQSILHQRLELAAPLALLAVGILLLPITRRRIIKPLDHFGRQLSRLADGEFTPAPLAEVDEFLLPLHQQFNQVAARLQELEAEHRARAASLEDEVRTATRALLAQQQTLARAERLAATGELAASVAHELRNPLAGIQMTLANLRRELREPEAVERVDLVLQEVTRLGRLLNELLDAARHKPESPRPLTLATLVDEMLTLARYQLPAAIRVTPQIPPDLTCRLPQDRLRQALLNLTLNAAAALDGRAGTITISAARDGDRLRITVADDGPGFPAELLEKGIRPFFSTRERGTGLGLAMVRRFARELGGDVRLANRDPHGAEATLELPLEVN